MDLAQACKLIYHSEPYYIESEQTTAWNVVFAAIEAGQLPVDCAMYEHAQTLLHMASSGRRASIVQRLLHLHASPSRPDAFGLVPMHLASCSGWQTLEKCTMLPVADLKCRDFEGYTPLHGLATALYCKAWADKATDELEETLRWMVQQFECPLDAKNNQCHTAADILETLPQYVAILQTAAAQKQRWTPSRAAWIAAVCCA